MKFARRYTFKERFLFPRFRRVNEAKLQSAVAGKTILITGASYGIGEALAKQLGKTKAKLILTGRTAEKLVTIQKTLRASGGSAELFPADLRDPTALAALIAFLKQRPIHVFVNNAGKSIRRSIDDSLDRAHDFTRTMTLNYHAPVELSLALIPLLKENRGQLVNISAVNVLWAPAPFWAAYQASKAAFDQWLRSVGPELRMQHVAVTSIYLPLVRTRMIEPTKHYKDMPAMDPEHVAALICHALYTRKSTIRPWWSVFGELGSVLFRHTWEHKSARWLKR